MFLGPHKRADGRLRTFFRGAPSGMGRLAMAASQCRRCWRSLHMEEEIQTTCPVQGRTRVLESPSRLTAAQFDGFTGQTLGAFIHKRITCLEPPLRVSGRAWGGRGVVHTGPSLPSARGTSVMTMASTQAWLWLSSRPRTFK